MVELIEIEKKITNLSQKDLRTFRDWFYDYDNQNWDKRFKKDVESGKLDNLSSKALLEFQLGEFSEL